MFRRTPYLYSALIGLVASFAAFAVAVTRFLSEAFPAYLAAGRLPRHVETVETVIGRDEAIAYRDRVLARTRDRARAPLSMAFPAAA